MIARQARHALAADVHLRPALLELGATCSTPSLVALESELASLGADGLVTAWLERSGNWLQLSDGSAAGCSPRRHRHLTT